MADEQQTPPPMLFHKYAIREFVGNRKKAVNSDGVGTEKREVRNAAEEEKSSE